MHDLTHIRRILRLARNLASDQTFDDELLTLGAYFHGTIYEREDDIRSYLVGRGLPADRVDKAVQIAWESQTNGVPETIEGKILHDAHLVEGGRTFLITKSLVTGTARGQSLEETLR